MKKKLLLADDSITIQKVVGIIFATEDYELLTVSDGDKAYDLVLTLKPDLVIADIVMPGKDGFELCRAIKSHPDLGTTSVLLLPGAFETFDEARAVDVCADGWLTKPFESQSLIDKVTALLAMPPLRLVAAADNEVGNDVADDVMLEETDSAPLMATVDDEEPTTAEAYDFSATDEFIAEPADLAETPDPVVEADSELWGEVSFEEEDLKPQELLAASDQDEDESADYSAQGPEDDDVYEPPQGLTPEQLAPYVSAPLSASPAEEPEASEFEPLPADSDDDVEFIDDQPASHEEVVLKETDETDETDGTVVMQEDESAPPFAFEAQNSLEENNHRAAAVDATHEQPEIMEEDLEQEEDLIEDSTTFIDLTAAEEVEVEDEDEDEVSADADAFTFEPDEETIDDEILELTEGDVLEENETLVAASDETSFVQSSIVDSDTLLEDPQEPVVDENEAEESLGRRDDDLFPGAVETPMTVTEESEAVTSATEDNVETELEAADLEEIEPEQYEEYEEMTRSAEIDDVDEITADTGRFDDTPEVPPVTSFVTPPLAAIDSGPSAEAIEEQLRQLPEEEVAKIVEKVAGPVIERLAREMLEQTVWEVVPDLAETMIRAEIEKIKRGEA